MFKNKTIDDLNSKINNLKEKINKYMIVTEQQNQIITNTEWKLNKYIEIINHY